MALNISQTPIPNTDTGIPAKGSSLGCNLLYDPLTHEEYFSIVTYSDPYQISTVGGNFAASGTSVNGGPARPEGIVLSAAIKIYIDPFVMNTLARFPMLETEMDHAWVNLTPPESIHKKTRTVVMHGEPGVDDTWTSTDETTGISGTIGVARLVVEDGVIVPRLIGSTSAATGSLDAGGAHDIIDQVKAMRAMSRGNCIGFTWFLMPDGYDISAGDSGNAESLRALLGTSNIVVNGIGYYEGTASVSWLEWPTGAGLSNEALTFNAHSILAPMPGPPPPRFD